METILQTLISRREIFNFIILINVSIIKIIINKHFYFFGSYFPFSRFPGTEYYIYI